MMVIAFFITVIFENQVPPAVQESIAQQTPFISVKTGGNLVVSLGNFLLATLVADLVMFVPLYLLGSRGESSRA